MSKADLYKYHKDPRYYPGRSMIEEMYESFGDYYDDLDRTNPNSTQKIRKKMVRKAVRDEKTQFFLGKL